MKEPQITKGTNHLLENFEDFFEQALCGFIIADAQGRITRANAKVASWAGCRTDELRGQRFSDLLSVGGKIYYETHLWPLLRMQGFFDEVSLEIKSNTGEKLKVLVNAIERRNREGDPLFIRYTILKASDRLQYEQNLQLEKKIAEEELLKQREIVILREQLIAVLGHDLRNPLSAISLAVEMLETVSPGEDISDLVATLKRSSFRMGELVKNIMDFARTRLGEGIILSRKDVNLKPVIEQVITELKLIYPKREIIASFDIAEPVNCDPHRIAQLLSNLLANALSHGNANMPVYLFASHKNGILELSVRNSGDPIPLHLRENLFTPFTREGGRPSVNGLGLGLYISKEIAVAHNATLSFVSNEQETCFTFYMHS
jgi:sigma-B regulation protein RsbU (phosphoserine phosphatase)